MARKLGERHRTQRQRVMTGVDDGRQPFVAPCRYGYEIAIEQAERSELASTVPSGLVP